VRLRKADLENPVFIAGLLRDGHWNLARRCGNAEAIRAALDELEGLSDLATLFLRSAVPGPAVVAQWVAAIDALRSLHRVSSGFGEKWGSRRREARIRALAQVPELVEGVRAVVVASTELVEPDWFAVLAADASPESVDALLPQVARALARDRQTLDALWAVVSRPGLHAALRPLGDALEAERRRIFTQAGSTFAALGRRWPAPTSLGETSSPAWPSSVRRSRSSRRRSAWSNCSPACAGRGHGCWSSGSSGRFKRRCWSEGRARRCGSTRVC
jgi:hypothetical protein